MDLNVIKNRLNKSNDLRIIKPPGKAFRIDLQEIFQNRELLAFFCWREVKVRYKQAVLGILWAILQPVLKMVVFSIIFGKIASINTNGIPYPIFSYIALLPWTLFSESVSRSGNSLVQNGALLKKVYIPPLIITIGSMLPVLFDFLIASTVLFAMLVYYHSYVLITWAILLLPLLVVLTLFVALTAGLWLSSLNVKYRDVRFIIPFIVQIWMYVSPVVYSTNEVPEGIWRWVYGLNPMAGVIQGFRWAILGGQRPDELLFLSILVTGCLFVLGIRYFAKTQDYIADIV